MSQSLTSSVELKQNTYGIWYYQITLTPVHRYVEHQIYYYINDQLHTYRMPVGQTQCNLFIRTIHYAIYELSGNQINTSVQPSRMTFIHSAIIQQIFDDANVVYLIRRKIVAKVLNFVHFSSGSIYLLNAYNQTIHNKPIMEIVYPDEINYLYSSYLVKDSIQTYQPNDLNINNESLIIRTNKHYLMDNAIVIHDYENEDMENIELEKTFTFKQNNNFSMIFQYVGTLETKSSLPYQVNEIIGQKNIWIWYPNSMIYLLIIPYPYQIYIMQTYNDDKVELKELPYLSNRLELPDEWLYVSMNLDKDMYLFVTSNMDTTILYDDLSNSYQYIKEDDANWLYDKYRPTETIG